MSDKEYKKPLPDVENEKTKPFWDAARKHELSMQKCPKCGYVRYPYASVCPECLEESNDWVKLSGKGKIWSYGIYHHLFNPSFQDDLPYNVALVQLDEGPKLVTNMVGVSNEEITVDMPVEVVFDDITPEVTLVKFKPA